MSCDPLACVIKLLLLGYLTSPATYECISGTDLLTQIYVLLIEKEAAGQAFFLTQPQYTDTGPTSSSADRISPGAWQGSHWSASFLSRWYESTQNPPPPPSPLLPLRCNRKSNPESSTLEAVTLTTRPTRRSPSTGLIVHLLFFAVGVLYAATVVLYLDNASDDLMAGATRTCTHACVLENGGQG